MSSATRKYLSSWVTAVVLAIIGSILLVLLFGYSSYDVDGVRLGFGVSPSIRGATELSIPPFGEITAATHKTPILLKVVLEKIYPHEISAIADQINGQGDLVHKIEIEGGKAFRQFVIRLIALAVIGGAAGAALFPRRRVYKALVGAFIGALLVSGILGATYYSFNIYSFKQPKYSGVLSVAPWATEDVAKQLADIKAFKKEISSIVQNVDSFYSKIDSWQPIQGDTIKVLHVSDIHNNPLAVDLIKHVVKDFHVDLVIDTGDVTDFGTPVETKLIDGIASLPVPYVFVPGNHDSPQIVQYLKGVKNVTVLDGGVVNVKGITIYGVPDPVSTTASVTPADDGMMNVFRLKVARALKSLPEKPLILAVHNPKAVRGLLGKVPVILVGHTHKAGLFEKNGYILDNAGTTGAAGLRTFQADAGVPYTLSLLNIDRKDKRVVAVDSLEIVGTEREFRLERNLIRGKTVSEAK